MTDAVVAQLRINQLGYLAPVLRRRAQSLTEMMTARGHDVRIFETLRLPALQQEYFRRGTSRQKDVLRSAHGHGLGFDFLPVVKGAITWTLSADWKADVLECAKACDLKCGGEWKSLVDWPHFQPIEYPGVVPSVWIEAFNRGGLHEVWTVAKMC